MFGLVPFRNGNIDGRRNYWDIGSIFEEFFKDSMFPEYKNKELMRVDVKENSKEYVVEADIPGAKKEDINLEIDENRLSISVDSKQEVNEENKNYLYRERRSSFVSRSFALENIAVDKATAKFENGVLTITLPKIEESLSKNRKIAIE